MPGWNGAASLLALLSWMAQPAPAAEPPAPEPIRFELERAAARAGESMTVTVLLRDGRGRPTDADEVALACDFCQVGAVEKIAEGAYRATLTAPRTIPTTRSLLLFARAGGTSRELEVPVVPGPPVTLAVSGPRAVLADGAIVELLVTLTDAFGNPAEAVPLARAARGALEEPRRAGPGRWTVGYRPRKVLARAQDEIAVEAGAARGAWTLRLDPRDAWLAVSAWSGVAASAGSTPFTVGAGLSWWWRDERDHLGILLDAGWWRLDQRTTVTLPGGPAELRSERSHLPLTASLSWAHQLGRRTVAWVAAGGGAARVWSAQRLPGQAEITEARWAPAATASVALGARALGGLAFLELRGLWIGDPGLATVTGASKTLLVLGGYRFDAL